MLQQYDYYKYVQEHCRVIAPNLVLDLELVDLVITTGFDWTTVHVTTHLASILATPALKWMDGVLFFSSALCSSMANAAPLSRRSFSRLYFALRFNQKPKEQFSAHVCACVWNGSSI